MAIAAGCTALSAYLIGNVINQAYVNRNLAGIITLGVVTVAAVRGQGRRDLRPQRCCCRASATASSPTTSARVFAKLLNEGLGFFSDRHSTEFIARLTAGATAATQVLNLLITSVGRDLLSLIGLVTVMVVQDPLMSFFSFVVAPPALLRAAQADPPHLRDRAQPVPRRHPHHRDAAGDAARHPHRQGLHARRHRCASASTRNVAAVEHEANKMARVSQPRQPADGDARRLRHRDRASSMAATA